MNHLLTFLTPLTLAQFVQADPPTMWNIRIEMQVVTIPDEFALPFVEELRDEKKTEAACAKI